MSETHIHILLYRMYPYPISISCQKYSSAIPFDHEIYLFLVHTISISRISRHIFFVPQYLNNIRSTPSSSYTLRSSLNGVTYFFWPKADIRWPTCSRRPMLKPAKGGGRARVIMQETNAIDWFMFCAGKAAQLAGLGSYPILCKNKKKQQRLCFLIHKKWSVSSDNMLEFSTLGIEKRADMHTLYWSAIRSRWLFIISVPLKTYMNPSLAVGVKSSPRF